MSKHICLTLFNTPESYPLEKGKKIPYFLVCPLANVTSRPTSVSLVLKRCENAENNLEIINNQPPDGVKKKFGVCTKQMNYQDREIAVRLIEWVHILRILGVDKIHGYNRHVHPNMFKAMNYFEEKGFAEFKPFLEPHDIVFKPRQWLTRTIEKNLLNDCFYRNKNIYEFIAVLDLDEVIMPVKETDRNWNDLLGNFKNKEQKDYFFFSYAFFENKTSKIKDESVPSHFYMLHHTEVKISRSFLLQILIQVFTAFKHLRFPGIKLL